MLEYGKILGLFLLVILSVPAGCRAEGNGEGERKTVSLPEPRDSGDFSLESALANRRSRRAFLDRPLELEAVSQLLWAAQGITEPGRGFRTAPSAGATYPLETWLVAGKVTGLEPGFYRYNPSENALELHKPGDLREELAAAALGQRSARAAPAVIVLSAVYERTAARYGERAERYVHMEAGHAGQNIYLQAEVLGLGTVAIGAFRDAEVESLLPLEGRPLYLYPVGHPAD